MNARPLLAEAAASDLQLWYEGGAVRWRGYSSAELLARLRSHKAEIIELLRGDVCRRCGGHLAWPRLGVGVVFGDGTAECMGCADREVGRLLAAGRRAVESPDA